MNTLRPLDQRFTVYRNRIEDAYEHKKKHKAEYYLANLALEELKASTEVGNEPDAGLISEAEYRFDRAADLSLGKDELMALRSRLLKAWIRPIVWAGVMNLEGLTKSEARHVADNVNLVNAVDDTAEIVRQALSMFDESCAIPETELSTTDIRRIRELSGFINEAAPIQLRGRHESAKLLVLPSLAYDDALNPVRSQRVDGYLLDNRKQRTDTPIYPFQVGYKSDHGHVSQLIPIIDPILIGNIRGSSYWPNDPRGFGTSRRLVTERRVDTLSQVAVRTLDRIDSSVVNTVLQAA